MKAWILLFLLLSFLFGATVGYVVSRHGHYLEMFVTAFLLHRHMKDGGKHLE